MPGVATVESASTPAGPWETERNYFTTNSAGGATVAVGGEEKFYRLLAADIGGTPEGHTALTESYGILETIAGRGDGSGDHVNYWRPEFEGAQATNVNLSRAHITFADPQNNLLVVDEGSSSVLKISTDGTIRTYAGTHAAGFNGDGPAPATTLQLNYPNGGWMGHDGTFFVVDTFNGKIRRIDTNGIMSTVFSVSAPINEGRGLWVNSDESEIYFCTGDEVHKWTPSGGVSLVRGGFLDLGNILGDDRTGDLYITDRDAHSVYRLSPEGVLTRIAGNGTTSGGGDGFPATQTGLNRPRTIQFLPNGGYVIAEHSPGNRVWYIDPAGIIHLWLNGSSNGAATKHVGDGEWFYANRQTAKVSKVRAVTMDRLGNLIVTESDYGFIRRINFHRLNP